MKKYTKIIAIAFAAVSVLASCTKETPYEPGKPAGSKDVFFSKENPSTVVLALSDTEFSVVLERSDASAAETVPLAAWCDVPNVISVPASVSFAAGETSVEVPVTLGECESFVNYMINISIPEEYTQPYKEDAGSPNLALIFYKEDYKLWKTGEYYDAFWYEDSWEQPIEYSEIQDTYRLSNVWADGYGFTFKFNPDTKDVAFASSAKIATGINHSSYGAISATPVSCGYDADLNAIIFVFKWTVSAGSFGEYEQVLYL